MSEDYIPSNDSSLIEFLKNFINEITGNEETFGINVTDCLELELLQNNFKNSYQKMVTDRTLAKMSFKQKDIDRKLVVSKARAITQIIQNNTSVTNAQRKKLRLNLKKDVKTFSSAPLSRPIVKVMVEQPLQHKIIIYDNSLPFKSKITGIKGAEIWLKIGDEPTLNEEEYRYIGTNKSKQYLVIHKEENIGKLAHYLLRWVNRKYETGPWRKPVSATILGYL